MANSYTNKLTKNAAKITNKLIQQHKKNNNIIT